MRTTETSLQLGANSTGHGNQEHRIILDTWPRDTGYRTWNMLPRDICAFFLVRKNVKHWELFLKTQCHNVHSYTITQTLRSSASQGRIRRHFCFSCLVFFRGWLGCRKMSFGEHFFLIINI